MVPKSTKKDRPKNDDEKGPQKVTRVAPRNAEESRQGGGGAEVQVQNGSRKEVLAKDTHNIRPKKRYQLRTLCLYLNLALTMGV